MQFHAFLTHRTVTPRVLAWIAVAALSAPAALAVDIEGVQNVTLDTPQVIGIFQRPGAANPIQNGRTTAAIKGYLDTGSSGNLFSNATVDALGLARLPGVTFSDVGIGGLDNFDVSEEIILRIAPNPFKDLDKEASYSHNVGPVRTQVGPVPAPVDPLLEDLDIYGMPTMIGKVVVMDPQPLDDLVLGGIFSGQGGPMNTYLYELDTPFNPGHIADDPGIPTTSHHVQLSYGSFDRFTQIDPSDAPKPNFAHNPFIGPDPTASLFPQGAQPAVTENAPPVTVTFGGHQATGSFLLDTAGQVSFVSTAIADQLGLHIELEPDGLDTIPVLKLADGTKIEHQFSVLVGGIGGLLTAPGFFLDELILQTLEGSAALDDPNNIRFLGAPVVVADIGVENPDNPDDVVILDGTFGMNFLVASLFIDGFNLGDLRVNPFRWITFDEPNGILGLDVAPAIVPEPGSMGLAAMGAALLAGYAWRQRRRVR